MVHRKPLVERMIENPDEIIIGADDRGWDDSPIPYDPDDPYKGIDPEVVEKADEIVERMRAEAGR